MLKGFKHWFLVYCSGSLIYIFIINEIMVLCLLSLINFSPWFKEHVLLTFFSLFFNLKGFMKYNSYYSEVRSEIQLEEFLTWNHSVWECVLFKWSSGASLFLCFIQRPPLMMKDRWYTGLCLPVCCNIAALYSACVRLGAHVFLGPNIFSFSALKAPFKLLCAENIGLVFPWFA